MRSRSTRWLGLACLVILASGAMRETPRGRVTLETGVLPDGSIGSRYVVEAPPYEGQPPAPQASQALRELESRSPSPAPSEIAAIPDTLWSDRNSLTSIPENVAMSGNGQHILAGWWLNNTRTSHYATLGTRTPTWVDTLTTLDLVPVSASYLGQLCATSGGLDSLDGYNGGSGFLLYDKRPRPFFSHRLIATCDSATVVVGTEARDDTTWIIGHNPSNGDSIWGRRVNQPVNGLDLSGNGSVLAVTTNVGVFLYNGLTGAPRDSALFAGGSPWPPALSRDGSLLVVGGYNPLVRLYQWNGSDYVLSWTHNTAATYVTAVNISDDGTTILAGTLVNTTPPSGTLSLFDVASSTPLWVLTSFGDEVSDVSLSAHGQFGAATSWGRKGASVGYVLALFKHDSWSPLEYAINDDQITLVGSFLSCEMSDNGQYCVAGAKSGHARTLGNGGSVWAVRTSGPETSAIGELPIAPVRSYALLEGRPNPANPLAVIPYQAPDTGGPVSLAIYDVSGRKVRTLLSETFQAGRHEAVWDGKDNAGRALPSGLYFYRLTGDGFESTRKLILAR